MILPSTYSNLRPSSTGDLNSIMDKERIHTSVMAHEVVEFLNLQPNMCIVDCTLGLGGHTQLILNQIAPNGTVIGIDRDQESLTLAQDRLKDFGQRCIFVHDDARNIDKILEKLNLPQVDGILFDLGISSYQLDTPERGFSLMSEGPLDMRMDKDSFISAYDLVNSLSEKEISFILKNYGQERFHHRIAHHLVYRRNQHPIESTKELSDIVLKAVPSSYQRQRIHPATRTFQAIRIAVNRELEALEVALNKCVNLLRTGARICVISFHSLEDKIVKEKFREFSKSGKLELIVKKPLRPTDEEIEHNSRSRSARMRIGQKI